MLLKTKEDNIMAEKYNTTVRITDFDINWKKIKSACMTTISKEAGDKEPSHDWKRKLLLSAVNLAAVAAPSADSWLKNWAFLSMMKSWLTR